MKILFHNVLWLLFFVAYQYICLAKESVTIGVLYSERNEDAEIVLNSTLAQKNRGKEKRNVYFEKQIKQVSNFDSFEASKVLCDALEEEEKVAAIMMLESPTSPILESICSHFEVPYITTFWKEPSDTPTETVLNFFPDTQLFAQALADIVKSLQWKSFAIICESLEGLIRMQEVLKLQNYNERNNQNKVLVKQLGPGLDHRSLLKEIGNASENNIILDCKTKNIIPILKQAKDQNLLQWDNNIFLTSPDAHTLDYKELNSTANITTIRLFDYESQDFRDLPLPDMDQKKIKTETVLFYDALLLLTDSINAMNEMRDNTTMSPIKCFVDGAHKTTYRYTLANYMKKKIPSSTLSGPLTFDTNGNRNNFTVYVVDIRGQVLAKWLASNTSLLLSRNANETEFANWQHLQKIVVNVSSKLDAPYLMKKEEEEGNTLYGNNRYEGYSMDLISEIAKIVGFEFQFVLNAENEYGKFDESKNKWTGLIGDILDRKAQLAICDLTITPARQRLVDFSVPFMNLGISILYFKENSKAINNFAFLDPFSKLVWIYTATLYLFISIVLYFVSRMTPGDWENPHPCDENPEELENIWDIKNCMWLTLGSIMTQGCDILPKGLSSRMAVSMWWFFSLIMTSSYTANLAAFLTKDKMEVSIDSAQALAKQTKIKYGAVDGGSTQTFFNDSSDPIYHKMWISMINARPSVFEKNNPDGVKRVRARKGNYAFLMESTRIEYEIQTKCDLRQVGNLLDTKNYGIAMPMNWPYRGAIDKAILKLQESGRLNELKKIWWIDRRKEEKCNETETDKDSAELDLANVGGVFYVLGVGVALAVIIAIIEFLWNVRSVSVEEHLTYWEALKVEFIFACKIWITKKRTKPVVSESSSSASHKSDKTENKSIVHSILQAAGSSMNLHK